MGLIQNDNQIFQIFDEAVAIIMPKQLRKFFAYLLISDNLSIGLNIWNKYKNYFTEDFETNKEINALNHLNRILNRKNVKCSDFGLPDPVIMKTEYGFNILFYIEYEKCVIDSLDRHCFIVYYQTE